MGATNTIIATLADPAAFGAGGVAVNTVSNTIFVINTESNNMTVINGATNTFFNVPTGTSPSAVAVNEPYQ